MNEPREHIAEVTVLDVLTGEATWEELDASRTAS